MREICEGREARNEHPAAGCPGMAIRFPASGKRRGRPHSGTWAGDSACPTLLTQAAAVLRDRVRITRRDPVRTRAAHAAVARVYLAPEQQFNLIDGRENLAVDDLGELRIARPALRI